MDVHRASWPPTVIDSCHSVRFPPLRRGGGEGSGTKDVRQGGASDIMERGVNLVQWRIKGFR